MKNSVKVDQLSRPSKEAPVPESAPDTRGVLPPPGFDSKPLRVEESFIKHKPYSEDDVAQKLEFSLVKVKLKLTIVVIQFLWIK